MKLRQLWKLLSGVALLVTGLLFGASAPAAGSTGGCAGDVVVALDVAVWSRPGHDTYGFTLSEPLPPGEWTVGASSSDGYPGRTETVQSQEQWLVDITDHVVLGPTTDLADGVEYATVSETLGTFVSAGGVSHFTIRHAAPSTPVGANSVTADCLSFTRTSPPVTTTSTTTTSTTTTSTTTLPPSSTTSTTTTSTTTTSTTTLPPSTTTSTTTTRPPSTTSTTTPPPTGPEIRASALVDCAAGQVYVLLGNNGERGATVDVALPLAAVDAGLVIEGGATTTSTLAIGTLEGAAEIRISDSVTGETYLLAPIGIDCDEPARPSATTVLDCATDVLVVVLGNDAGDPAALTVVHERVAVIAEVEVEVGETVQVEVPIDGAATIPIRVTDGEGRDVLRVAVDNVCPPTDDGDGSGPGGTEDDTGGADPPAVPSDDGPTSCADVATAPACAEIKIVVEPDCPSSLANVSIRRDGVGRERFVVLVGGVLSGVVAIDGSGEGTVPVAVGGDDADLTVSRSTSPEPVVVGTLSCDSGTGRAGPIAASLLVFAVLATGAGTFAPLVRAGPF